jgi:hypothetical protein
MKFLKNILDPFRYLKNKTRPWRKRKKIIEKSLLDLDYQTRMMVKLNAWEFRRKILSETRSLEKKRLLSHGFKAYSQNDEDGIIQEIFHRIGTVNKNFVEIGVGNGLENNTLYLLLQGWRGLWVESNPRYVTKDTMYCFPDHCQHRFRRNFYLLSQYGEKFPELFHLHHSVNKP